MLGSMFSGISGLMSNSQAINVVGNNIANVNTIGFKGSRATFSDLLYQSVNGTAGASQVGRGSTLTTVDTQFAQGSFESTSEPTDLAIGGKGFFIVKSPKGNITEYYTRAGQFRFDKDGYLTNPEGLVLQGKAIDQTTGKAVGVDTNIIISQKPSDPKITSAVDMTANLQSNAEWKGSIGNLDVNGDIASVTNTIGKWPIAGEYTAQVTTVGGVSTLTVTVERVGPDGTTKIGAPIVKSKAITAGQSMANFEDLGLDITIAPTITNTTQKFTISGFNVDKPTATANYSSSITVYDSNGQSHVVTVYFRKSNIDISSNNSTWEWMAVVGAGDSATGKNTMAASGDLVFNSSGVLQGEGSNHQILFNFTAPAKQNQPITLSFGSLSSVSGNPKDPMTQYPIDSATNYQAQNGYPPGTLLSVSVDADGIISGHYSNGQIINQYQITLANFGDTVALTKEGSNLFSSNNKTGEAYKYAPGVSGTGKINPNSLEQSNVDLATEFVKMIVAQRGFQANSRVITTSDEVLQELMNLKR
ncbi:MAG TPA: flagellar hook protein FlgE [Syntrophorhabdaceae bacterium]|nr:flagellar hook protein FlgE [Syntrophorhabdaceae bacterium]